MLKDYLYGILLICIAAGWLVDRTRQFDEGKASCIQSIAQSQADYEKRHKDEEQKKIASIDKEATKAADHINSLDNEKTKAVEHTRVIVKTIPSNCSKPSADIVRDYNEALSGLQRH